MEFAALASGSTGNCYLIRADGTNILIDAGISLRRITTALKGLDTDIGDVSAVFITHEHKDHIAALPMLAKYCHIPVYATEGTADAIAESCPGAANDLHRIHTGEVLRFGTLEVMAFRTSHDAAESVGYQITHQNRRMAILTDTGVVTPQACRAARGCQTVVLESNHDVNMLNYGPYPYPLKQRIRSQKGHLSNDECAAFAVWLCGEGTRRFVLAHLSRENNTPRAALETVSAALSQAGVQPGKDVALDAAPMLGLLGPFEV